MKGEDINLIGHVQSLDKNKKEWLRANAYEYDKDKAPKPGDAKKEGKFFADAKAKIAKDEANRKDKHLLPRGEDMGKEGKVDYVLPFKQIDLIFNHKNIWANLQNQDPMQIFYHIHDKEQWHPLIEDPDLLHPFVKKEREGGDSDAESAKGPEKKKKKKKKSDGEEDDPKIKEMKYRGDFMKAFDPFYAPKAMEPPLSEREVEKTEGKIQKEVEMAIKQVRSSRNLNAYMHNTLQSRTIIKQYLDFMEDRECCRFATPLDEKKERIRVNKELIKLVPENFKISMLPAFFNHIDADRIGTVVRDTSQKFLLDTPKKVKFSVAVKIFPYNSNVNSVRLVLVKFSPIPVGAADDEQENDDEASGMTRSKKSGGSKKSRKD